MSVAYPEGVTVIPVMFNTAAPELVRVITGHVGNGVIPTWVAGHVTDDGVSVVTGVRPMPVTDRVCGLSEALSVIVSVPLNPFDGTGVVGAKVTTIAHVAPALRLVPHALTGMVNAPDDMLMLAMVRVAVPVLVRTSWQVAVSPAPVVGHDSVAGVSETLGATPFPWSGTVNGLPAPP